MAEEANTSMSASAGESDGTHHNVRISGVVGTKVLTSKARRRNKHGKEDHPKLKRRLSKFERHYSRLQEKDILIPERKRIDYVLVYPNVQPADINDNDKRKRAKRNEKFRAKFTEKLKAEGFSVQEDKTEEDCFVKLHCPFKRLCVEAQKIHLEMPLHGCAVPQEKPQSACTRFIQKHFETDNEEDYVSAPFYMDQVELFKGHEDLTHFFRPALRSFLTHHILINMDIRTETEKNGVAPEGEGDDVDVDAEIGCCARVCGRWCVSSHFVGETPSKQDKMDNRMLKKRGLPFLLMKGAYTDAFILHEDSMKTAEKEKDYFYDTPSHAEDVDSRCEEIETDPRKDLDDTWPRPFKFQPLWKIRNYFGEKIALYFAWSGLLISTLWIPTLFGICVFFYGLFLSVSSDGATNTTAPINTTASLLDDLKGTVDDVLSAIKAAFDNDVTPFFALVICLWGTIFLEMWKRKNARLAYEWDVDNFETNEPDRPQFFGVRTKKDPVTDDEMWFYPFKRRFLKYFASASVLIFMMCVVLIGVVMVIVYRIIMSVDYCPNMSSAACLLVATISSSLLNAVCILVLGKVYDILALCLTKWENHRTQTKFDDSLIIKLFAFQFVNSYSSLFYIAFFRESFDAQNFLGTTNQQNKYRDSCSGTCMSQLSFQVLVLMLAKPFPKFLKDIILPWLKSLWRRRPACCCRCKNQVDKEDGEKKKHTDISVDFLRRERLKPDLGDFTLSEYTEKVIQYGFLMLFAAAFPLAPLLALLTNLIDIRVDAKRMLWWYRRPMAFIAQDIGKWYDILTFVNFVGVLTNAFIIAFTSTWGHSFSLVGKLWIVIGFEHIVFLAKYLLAYLIPDVPSDVTLAIRREKYQVYKLMEGTKEKTQQDYAHLISVQGSRGRALSDTREEDEDDAEDGRPPSYNFKGGNPTQTPAGVAANGSGTQRYSSPLWYLPANDAPLPAPMHSFSSDKVSVSAIQPEEKKRLGHDHELDMDKEARGVDAGHPDRGGRQNVNRKKRRSSGRASHDVTKRKSSRDSRKYRPARRGDVDGAPEGNSKSDVFVMDFGLRRDLS